MEGTKERHCLRCLLEEIDCSYLNAGTCTACGCFVELRAALRTGHCPYRKWESGSRKREKG